MKNLVANAKNKAHEMKTAVMASDKGGKEIIVELGQQHPQSPDYSHSKKSRNPIK